MNHLESTSFQVRSLLHSLDTPCGECFRTILFGHRTKETLLRPGIYLYTDPPFITVYQTGQQYRTEAVIPGRNLFSRTCAVYVRVSREHDIYRHRAEWIR